MTACPKSRLSLLQAVLHFIVVTSQTAKMTLIDHNRPLDTIAPGRPLRRDCEWI
jgi:hypothetical protein